MARRMRDAFALSSNEVRAPLEHGAMIIPNGAHGVPASAGIAGRPAG